MGRILFVGGGIVGTCAAMMLADDGHDVTVIERDPTPPPPPDTAWDDWDRRGVNQFRMLHYFLPGFRSVMQTNLPEVMTAFHDAGADLIDVSSGQTTRAAKPVYGRMYQTPFADRIRNEVGIATMAVGAIFEPDHVNSILMAGRADLCALARPHLVDPAVEVAIVGDPELILGHIDISTENRGIRHERAVPKATRRGRKHRQDR